MTPQARFQSTNNNRTERFSNGITINMMSCTEEELTGIAMNYEQRLIDATIDVQIARDYLDRRFPRVLEQDPSATQPIGAVAMSEMIQ